MNLKSPAGLRSTLGFFIKGIPVAFVKTDALLGSGANGYAEFLNKSEDEVEQDPALSDDLCFAYERFITRFHEIRHFHDALLCKPLFETFLLQNKITWYVMQLVGKLAGLGVLPKNLDDPILASDPRIVELKALIFDSDEASFLRYQTLWDPHIVDGTTITLEHLLEASAMVSELLHLYSVHGVRAVHSYFALVVEKTEEKYNALIKMFVDLYGGLIAGLAALYAALGYSLYSSDDPTLHFALLFLRLKSNPHVVYEETAEWLYDPFANEAEFARSVFSTGLIHPSTGKLLFTFGDPETKFMDDLATFHHSIYGARKQLIDTYLVKFRYSSQLYFERMDELPIPPILFYPLEAASQATIMPGVRESDLKAQGFPYFVISAYEGDQDKVILAGMVALAGIRPCVSFDIADMHLFNSFCYMALFRGEYQVYSPPIDSIYLELLKNLIFEPKGPVPDVTSLEHHDS
jgi:hypothetical protein